MKVMLYNNSNLVNYKIDLYYNKNGYRCIFKDLTPHETIIHHNHHTCRDPNSNPNFLHNSVDILKDIIKIGKFVEKNYRKQNYFNKSKLEEIVRAEDSPNQDKRIIELIEEMRKPQYEFILNKDALASFGLEEFLTDSIPMEENINKDEFISLVANLHDKYGFSEGQWYCKLNDEEDFPEIKQKGFFYDISLLINYCHRIYIIFIILNKIFKNSNEEIKSCYIDEIVKTKDKDLLITLFDTCEDLVDKRSLQILFDEIKKKYIFIDVFEDTFGVAIFELKKLFIGNEEIEYENSFLSICENCNNTFESFNRNKKYCDDRDCIRDRNRDRKNKSNANKKKGGE